MVAIITTRKRGISLKSATQVHGGLTSPIDGGDIYLALDSFRGVQHANARNLLVSE